MYTAAERLLAVAIVCLTSQSAPGGRVAKIGSLAENPEQAG